MERKFVKDVMKALTILGCDGADKLKVGGDYHVTAVRPGGTRVYVTTVADAEKLILTLSRERAS